ncbi:MAG: hypothetical protein ACJAT2_002727 [Bacteriovoracaceae bacterium]|jgi:hypothetical protein
MQAALFLAFTIILAANAWGMEVPAWGGDLRYRNERIDEDSKDSRFRNRIRARLTLKGEVQDELSYSFRLASGSTDPVSSNQSLDSGFSTKGINLDLAYLTYQTKLARVMAGKMKNPFVKPGKTELIWDGDLSPEGIAVHLPFHMFFANLGYFFTEERSTAPDSTLHGAQVGINHKDDFFGIIFGLSYYDYLRLRGESPLFDSTDSFGNSTVAGNYKHDFNLAEAFLEVNLKTKLPLSFFADFVKNTEGGKDDTAYLVGLSLGKKIKFSYNYREVEKDAVLGAFTDSDFAGGGTDGKGHELGLSYSPSKKTKFGFSHFMNKTLVTNGKDYQRSMLDFSLKF